MAVGAVEGEADVVPDVDVPDFVVAGRGAADQPAGEGAPRPRVPEAQEGVGVLRAEREELELGWLTGMEDDIILQQELDIGLSILR